MPNKLKTSRKSPPTQKQIDGWAKTKKKGYDNWKENSKGKQSKWSYLEQETNLTNLTNGEKKLSKTCSPLNSPLSLKELSSVKKPYVPINRHSKKREQLEARIQKAYREVDEREPFCTGCGRSGIPLSHSHTIPLSRSLVFAADPLNIELECLECHTKFESHDWEKMSSLLNFQKKLDYIRTRDLTYYHILLNKKPNTDNNEQD